MPENEGARLVTGNAIAYTAPEALDSDGYCSRAGIIELLRRSVSKGKNRLLASSIRQLSRNGLRVREADLWHRAALRDSISGLLVARP